MKNTMWLFAAAFLCACSPKGDPTLDLMTITIDANSGQATSLNGLLSPQTVISLDTTVLVAGVGDLCLIDSNLYLLDDQQMAISMFTNQGGEALNTIKAFGGGPEEYIQPTMLSTDGASLFLLDFAGSAILEYDKGLRFVRKIKLESPVNDFVCVPEGFLCFNSWMGGEACPVVVYNKEGEVQQRINFKRPVAAYGAKGKVFFEDQGQVYFRPFFCDTIYQYKPEALELSPVALLDFQDKAIPSDFDFQNDVFASPYAFATHVFAVDGCWVISYMSGGSRYYALGKAVGGKSDSYHFDGKSGEVFFPQWKIGDRLVTVVLGPISSSREAEEENGCWLLLRTLNMQR
ncbi:MAG: 6-bladed beta-propeller [Tannerellaceae bacterium]